MHGQSGFPQYDNDMWAGQPAPQQPQYRPQPSRNRTSRKKAVKKNGFQKFTNKVKRFFKRVKPKSLAAMWFISCLVIGFWYRMTHKPPKIVSVKEAPKAIVYKGRVQK